MYFSVVSGNDVRFNHKSFQVLPLWLITKKIESVKQDRNLNQLTLSRFLQCFINSKLDPKKSKTIDSEVSFLPHPDIWETTTEQIKLPISKDTAKEVIDNYNLLDVETQLLLREHLDKFRNLIR